VPSRLCSTVHVAFHRVADPLRHPLHRSISLALLPCRLINVCEVQIGGVADKVRVGLVRLLAVLQPTDTLLAAPEQTTEAFLQRFGFSAAMIERFFRPFLGGIFFNRELTVTSRLFMFVMRMLAIGSNCLPAAGIGGAPRLKFKDPFQIPVAF
jgi:hypothetical protein